MGTYLRWVLIQFSRLGTYSNKYRKIPKISPGLIFFKGPFRGAYFWEGLILGGAYIGRGLSTEGHLRLKIDRSSLIVGG